jgi:hypothetical protein
VGLSRLGTPSGSECFSCVRDLGYALAAICLYTTQAWYSINTFGFPCLRVRYRSDCIAYGAAKNAAQLAQGLVE